MRYNPRIDTVVVTHPDADHYNDLPDVLTDAHHPVRMCCHRGSGLSCQVYGGSMPRCARSAPYADNVVKRESSTGPPIVKWYID